MRPITTATIPKPMAQLSLLLSFSVLVGWFGFDFCNLVNSFSLSSSNLRLISNSLSLIFFSFPLNCWLFNCCSNCLILARSCSLSSSNPLIILSLFCWWELGIVGEWLGCLSLSLSLSLLLLISFERLRRDHINLLL